MSPRPEISVVLVNWNTRDLLRSCLASVRAHLPPLSHEVIVVDNGSSDGSAEMVAREFPEAQLVQNGENLGFGRANNVAAREARGKAFLLLNPDTVVLDGAIQQLHRFASAQRPEVVAGGRTFFANGALNPGSCWGELSLRSLFCMATGLAQLFPRSLLFNPHALGDWQRDTVREVGVVAGCLLWIRRELWERLDGFDPDFFMYAEDVDLCMRARATGARCMICPDARIVHYAGVSEKVRADKMVRLFRARAQLMRKHWARPRARLGVALLSFWALMRRAGFAAASRLHPRFQSGHATWSQIWSERGAWQGVL
jgi:GT2 family glycosyltransferase